MITAAATEFVDHWDKLAGTALIPRSRDFLDNPPHRLMSSICIGECTERGMLLRFAGSSVCTELGEDLTGTYWENRLSPQERARFLSDLNLVCNFPVGLHCQIEIETSDERALKCEVVYFPLAVDFGKPQRCVGLSKIFGELKPNERATWLSWPHEATWIDVGAGAPATAHRWWEL